MIYWKEGHLRTTFSTDFNYIAVETLPHYYLLNYNSRRRFSTKASIVSGLSLQTLNFTQPHKKQSSGSGNKSYNLGSHATDPRREIICPPKVSTNKLIFSLAKVKEFLVSEYWMQLRENRAIIFVINLNYLQTLFCSMLKQALLSSSL